MLPFDPLMPQDCVFCLSEDVDTQLLRPSGQWTVTCQSCGASGPVMAEEADAVVAWNIRVENPHVQ